ncbi:unnamed protein product [Urochloa humidicola]
MEACSKEMRNPATRLTDDLIVEILSRLPVKSLCRFRCVSKAPSTSMASSPIVPSPPPQEAAPDPNRLLLPTSSSERIPESSHHFTNFMGRDAPLIHPSLYSFLGYADINILGQL